MRRLCEQRYEFDRRALAYAMRRAGLDERGLSGRSGVSQSTISLYLGGRTSNPLGATLLQLSDALGCDPHDLMREVAL